MAESKRAWDEVGESFTDLGRQLKQRFEHGSDGGDTKAVEGALRSLADAVTRLGEAIPQVVKDPAVKESASRAATSMTDALAATFEDVSSRIAALFAKEAPPNETPARPT